MYIVHWDLLLKSHQVERSQPLQMSLKYLEHFCKIIMVILNCFQFISKKFENNENKPKFVRCLRIMNFYVNIKGP